MSNVGWLNSGAKSRLGRMRLKTRHEPGTETSPIKSI